MGYSKDAADPWHHLVRLPGGGRTARLERSGNRQGLQPRRSARHRGRAPRIRDRELDCDFGRGEGRPDHPGEQAWILSMAVADTHRRHGVGRTLITEIARRAQQAGRTFLALAPRTAKIRLAEGRFSGRADSPQSSLAHPARPGAARLGRSSLQVRGMDGRGRIRNFLFRECSLTYGSPIKGRYRLFPYSTNCTNSGASAPRA
ncbi:GNAT family N-acetyltransferase [Streptomyces fungicidicus]|uniref:GNAT family N-acetyltransferase n=1 Tax=Streptomyces fungicidicus TaxID=68203 RepID=UPI0033EB27A2